MNKLNLTARLLSGLVALVAIGSGFGMMFNPDGLLEGLALTPEGVVGYSSLRGLIGGSQLAFGVVFAIAAIRARADAILVGAIYFGAVVLGRVMGLTIDGVDPFAIRATVFAGVLMLVSFTAFVLFKKAARV